jgi:hypothetical protein
MRALRTVWESPSRGRVCTGAPLRRSAPKARRLRCGARVSVAPHNSLHSLRSFRSNRCGESVHEAREYARQPKPCAPRRRTGAPAPTRPRLGEAPAVLWGRRSKAGHRARLSPGGAPAARGKPRARRPRLATHPPPRTLGPARHGAGRPHALHSAHSRRSTVFTDARERTQRAESRPSPSRHGTQMRPAQSCSHGSPSKRQPFKRPR